MSTTLASPGSAAEPESKSMPAMIRSPAATGAANVASMVVLGTDVAVCWTNTGGRIAPQPEPSADAEPEPSITASKPTRPHAASHIASDARHIAASISPERLRPRRHRAVIAAMKYLLVAVALVLGCGDNSDECGPGTKAVGGVCTAIGSGSGTTCGAGTMFDPTQDACVPATGICGDGTVLVGGTCQDPSAGITVDLEEGPEPNGFEPGAAPAGTITLAPVGDPHGFVIHGCIVPVGDTADFDRYVVTVPGPTLIDITAAGVGGLAGAFAALDPSFDFERFGLALAADTAEREVYLPAAGTFSIAIADARTLLGVIDNGGAPAAGNPDGSSCYYVTLQQETPAPVPLSLAAGNTGAFSTKLQFFDAPPGTLPSGFTDLVATIAAAEAEPALDIFQNGALRMMRDGGAAGAAAEAVFGAILPSDDVTVVVDDVFDYAAVPSTFTLGIAAKTTAQPLPSDGSSVTAQAADTALHSVASANLFSFDVGSAGELDALALALSQPMQGAIVDGDFQSVADFGGLAGSPSAFAVFSSYEGVIATRAPGRYYLALYGPTIAAGTSYTVTSTRQVETPVPLTSGTPQPATPLDAGDALVFSFAPATTPWATLNATGTNTGDVAVALYDPTTVAGRLGALAVTTNAGAAVSPGTPPLVAPFSLPSDGSAPAEYIFASLPEASVIAAATATPTGAAPAIAVDLEPVAFVALGELAAGTTMHTDEAQGALRYLAMSPKSSALAISATAVSALQIQELSPTTDVLSISSVGSNVSLAVTQDPRGYTALRIPASFGTHVALQIVTTYPFYTATSPAETFTDACAGGVDITPADTDEGITAPLAVPVGFTFYGAAVTQWVASTNGFVSFDPALADPMPAPGPFNDASNVAPFWQDLHDVQICERSMAGALVVQWNGTTPTGGAVRVQAILDPSTNSIEFAFGPAQTDRGDGAVQGVHAVATADVTLTGDGSVEEFGFPNTAVSLAH